MKQHAYQDICVRWDDLTLEIGNSRFSRKMDLSAGYPRTVSLRDTAGTEFAAPDKETPDCSFIGLNRKQALELDYRLDGVKARTVEKTIFEAAHVLVELSFHNDYCGAKFRREFILYPGIAAHAVRNAVATPVIPQVYWNYRSLRADGNGKINDPERTESCVDSIRPAAGFHPTLSVEFVGRTDYYDDLVLEHALTPEFQTADGNLLYVQNQSGAGFGILQEAPPSAERRDLEPYDFRNHNGDLLSCNWGIAPYEVKPEAEFVSVRNALFLFRDAAERAAILKDYLALRFPMKPSEYAVTVNPWGCGNFPKQVSPEFLNQEIAAAAECGADYYQIDDSWQRGEGLADLINNHHIGLDFWDVSPKRMNGTLEPQLETARRTGVKPALWIAPTHNIEFRDHEAFAELLLNFHRNYGFDLIKIDGVFIRGYEAERNLEKLLRTVRERSNGKVYFNLDTTNGQRPGYFMFLEYGNIFLQNRYTCHDWSIGYHPEKTLRSLWQLTRYMRPQSLQIEIPAPEQINPALYKKIGRALPDAYPFEYWASIALFANPLIWMAPSQVSAEHRATLRRMMELQKSIREQLFAGHVYPVGTEPGKGGLTGFYGDAGYLIVYRETGCDTAEQILTGDFPSLPYRQAQLISGSGSVELKDGEIHAVMPQAASYALFRLS